MIKQNVVVRSVPVSRRANQVNTKLSNHYDEIYNTIGECFESINVESKEFMSA